MGKDTIHKTLVHFHRPGDVFEVCLISPSIKKHSLWGNDFAGGKKAIVAGWFSDFDKAANIILEAETKTKPDGVYITLNPCNPALLGRANNRLKTNVNRTKDNEISEVRHFLIDADPERPEGVCSTDEEKEQALSLLRSIYSDLKSKGWPDPLVGDSGNGGHLIYELSTTSIDQDTNVIPKVLKTLSQQYSTDRVKIDTKVGNPARLVKVYGTMVRKGDSTRDRPHRMSAILRLPGGAL